MELIPAALRIVLNILFYFVYSILVVFVSGFIFPLFGTYIKPEDPMAVKISLVIMVLVLIITFIFRKFFYISLKK